MHTLSLERITRNAREIAGGNGIEGRLTALLPDACEPLLVLAAEIALAVAAYVAANMLLSRDSGAGWARATLHNALAASIAFGLLASLCFRLYRRSLRHANLLDLFPLFGAVMLNAAFLSLFTYWRLPRAHTAIALFAIDAAMLAPSWGVLHFGPRAWRAHLAVKRKRGSRVIIVGAGDAGLSLLKEIALDPSSPLRPVGLVDDDAEKWGRAYYGVPVLGGTHSLAKAASAASADEVLVCIPSATHPQMHRILGACRRLNIPVRSLPSLPELLQNAAVEHMSPRHLRGPKIEYLLQRDEFQVDPVETHRLVEGKVVLVTGAGGCIGSELARQIAAGGPARLLLLDKSENSLFYANLEVTERLGAERVKPILADLSVRSRTHAILKSERPHIVFHAAAHKHVSMIELHPQEAIRNNVLGTRNLAEAALECSVSSFVNISTDKAVDPSNFMGLSKKITELCLQELSSTRSNTRFASVRFGNVAGSTGSVIRLFWEQIQRGGPIRVTDPNASRYFMSVSEAVHLILGAAKLGRDGETFVFEMGEPFNIYELAKTLALFSGLRAEKDIVIEFIGLRRGEKLNEQLWDEWEHPTPTSAPKILAIRERDPRSAGIRAGISAMERFLAAEDSKGLLRYVAEIFPAFGAQAGGLGAAVSVPQAQTTREAMSAAEVA